MQTFAVAVLLAAAVPACAATSLEDLGRLGVNTEALSQGLARLAAKPGSERDDYLKLTRMTGDKAAGIVSALSGVDEAVVEAKTDLAALAQNPADRQLQTSISDSLKSMEKVLSEQALELDWMMSIVIHVKFSLPKGDAEFIAAIKDTDARIGEADAAAKMTAAAIAEADTLAQQTAGLKKLTKSLSKSLNEYASRYQEYSSAVRAHSQELVDLLSPKS